MSSISLTENDGEQVDFLRADFLFLHSNEDLVVLVITVGEEKAAVIGFIFELTTMESTFLRHLKSGFNFDENTSKLIKNGLITKTTFMELAFSTSTGSGRISI